ncbi:hypothetical protein J8273_5046 [Carpediemonas membranifera]|uniref:Uncharacterized protein n=1 Tax=Carpediemonas membranifera TaxID=201153 RepID=A0A8J6B3K2_9EUKA|nr:hypothetical protein J8273_5046 [Carpediemonas membranifera]|eukprot:KAG9393559.1 hypothetical protein J8273_5046 [Carpediemonas membranifera]
MVNYKLGIMHVQVVGCDVNAPCVKITVDSDLTSYIDLSKPKKTTDTLVHERATCLGNSDFLLPFNMALKFMETKLQRLGPLEAPFLTFHIRKKKPGLFRTTYEDVDMIQAHLSRATVLRGPLEAPVDLELKDAADHVRGKIRVHAMLIRKDSEQEEYNDKVRRFAEAVSSEKKKLETADRIQKRGSPGKESAAQFPDPLNGNSGAEDRAAEEQARKEKRARVLAAMQGGTLNPAALKPKPEGPPADWARVEHVSVSSVLALVEAEVQGLLEVHRGSAQEAQLTAHLEKVRSRMARIDAMRQAGLTDEKYAGLITKATTKWAAYAQQFAAMKTDPKAARNEQRAVLWVNTAKAELVCVRAGTQPQPAAPVSVGGVELPPVDWRSAANVPVHDVLEAMEVETYELFQTKSEQGVGPELLQQIQEILRDVQKAKNKMEDDFEAGTLTYADYLPRVARSVALWTDYGRRFGQAKTMDPKYGGQERKAMRWADIARTELTETCEAEGIPVPSIGQAAQPAESKPQPVVPVPVPQPVPQAVPSQYEQPPDDWNDVANVSVNDVLDLMQEQAYTVFDTRRAQGDSEENLKVILDTLRRVQDKMKKLEDDFDSGRLTSEDYIRTIVDSIKRWTRYAMQFEATQEQDPKNGGKARRLAKWVELATNELHIMCEDAGIPVPPLPRIRSPPPTDWDAEGRVIAVSVLGLMADVDQARVSKVTAIAGMTPAKYLAKVRAAAELWQGYAEAFAMLGSTAETKARLWAETAAREVVTRCGELGLDPTTLQPLSEAPQPAPPVQPEATPQPAPVSPVEQSPEPSVPPDWNDTAQLEVISVLSTVIESLRKNERVNTRKGQAERAQMFQTKADALDAKLAVLKATLSDGSLPQDRYAARLETMTTLWEGYAQLFEADGDAAHAKLARAWAGLAQEEKEALAQAESESEVDDEDEEFLV